MALSKRFKNVVVTDKVIKKGETGYNLIVDGEKKCLSAVAAIACVRLAEKTNASVVEDKYLRLKSGSLNVINPAEGKSYNVDKTVKKLKEKAVSKKPFDIRLKNGITVTIVDNSTPHEAGG